MARLGCEKICHQPFSVNACAGRIDVRKSPAVGTSHSNPSASSTSVTGARVANRIALAATVSRSTFFGWSRAMSVTVPSGTGGR